VFLQFLAHIIPVIRYTKNVKFSFEIYLSLGSVDVIMTSSKMTFFVVSKMKKADKIPDNNFYKIKPTFTIFGRQH